MSSTNSSLYLFALFFTLIQLILAHWEPDLENSKDFLGCFLNMRYKPISVNINTNTLLKISTPTPLEITATEYDSTVLVNTGQSLQTTNTMRNIGNATGGLLPGTYIRLGWTYYWTKDCWSEETGTTINGKGFPLEVRVLWRNSKYSTLSEAVKHQDGITELLFVYNMCSTASKPFDKVIDVIKKLCLAGSFKVVPASLHIDASNFISRDGEYYSYLGSFLDTYTGLKYKCSRVIFTKPNAEYCITPKQFKEAFSDLRNFYGLTYTNTLPHDPSNVQVSAVGGGIIQNLLTCS